MGATGTSIIAKCKYRPSQVMSGTSPCSESIMQKKKTRWPSYSTKLLHQHEACKHYNAPKGKLL